MNEPEYILTDELAAIVAIVGANVAPALAAAVEALQLPNALTLQFRYGYVTEINEILAQQSKNATDEVLKYPLIWLEQPYTVKRGGIWYGSTTLRLFIIMQSDKNYRAPDRMANVIKPILYPIYRELMKQINESPVFITLGIDRIPHLKTDYYYFSDPTGKKSVFNDVIDCVCISNLQLNITNNLNCLDDN